MFAIIKHIIFISALNEYLIEFFIGIMQIPFIIHIEN